MTHAETRSDLGVDSASARLTLSRNSAPGFGRAASDVCAAVCGNATGVTKSTIGGPLAADLACGVGNPLIADMESLGQPQRLPPQPFLGIGVRLRERWELWRNRAERQRAPFARLAR